VAQSSEAPPEGRFRISEIYATIQGESSLVGYPTVFVRLYTCNLRCAWCDSMHAVEGGEYAEQGVDAVVDRVRELAANGIHRVCWTGGEPLLQWRAMAQAIGALPPHLLHSVETDGEVPLEPIGRALPEKRAKGLLRFIMDVKCPGSGMTAKLAVENLAHLGPEDEVKFVILDRGDYEFARGFVKSHRIPAKTILFSPVAGAHQVASGLDPAKLAAWMLEDGIDVRLQLQVHKYVWPGKERGI
jgi:7-carboxy-7-deazaguanine synthase